MQLRTVDMFSNAEVTILFTNSLVYLNEIS